jgi:hypothetical protein
MLEKLIICAVVSASVAACTSTTTRPPPPAQTADLACPRSTTASRISTRAGECSSSPIRTYTQQDIDRTGQTDVGSALRMLDPSISTH